MLLTQRATQNAELWRTQKAFIEESKSNPYTGFTDYTIKPAYVHKLFQSIINAATTPDTKGRSSELWEMQKKFALESSSSSYVHAILKSAADTAKREGNPERVLELWKMQQAFAIESKRTPTDSNELIHLWTVNQTLKSAADTANTAGNPERMIELWSTQQAFTKESGAKPNYATIILSSEIHKAFSVALDKETNSTRIVTLFETWVEFAKTQEISKYDSFKRPDAFKAKYDAAKKEVEAKATGPAVHSTASSRPLRPEDDGYYKDLWLIEDHMGRRSNLD